MTSLFNKTLGYLEDIREVVVGDEPLHQGSRVNTEACESFVRLDAASAKKIPYSKANSRRDSQKDSLAQQWERRVKRGSLAPQSSFKNMPGKTPSFVEAKGLVDAKITRKSSFQAKETMSPLEIIQNEKRDLPDWDGAFLIEPLEPLYDDGRIESQ
jgi:hypothetical protein